MKAISEDIPVKEKLPRFIDKSFGESEKQMTLVTDYAQQQINEYFFKLHYKSLPLIIKLRDCFPLYFYMCDNVTRGKGRHHFWNNKIVPYYKQGFLPFAKHQDKIAEALGVSQGTISVYLKTLKENELIAKLGKEYYSDERPMDVWAVGKWIEDDKGIRHEVYYLQALTFEKDYVKLEF